MTRHVLVHVIKIGDYKLPEPEICRFVSSSYTAHFCCICGEIIDVNEIHFRFDGNRYCIGCVQYF